MNLTHLTSAALKPIITLVEQKEALEAQLEEITLRLAAWKLDVESKAAKGPADQPTSRTPRKAATTSARAVATKAAGTAKRQPRGQLKESVLAQVKAAGSSGIRVADLAAKLGAKPKSLFVWFHSTGKRVTGLQKVGPGRYAWVDPMTSPCPF
ncbi:MAG: hypothetical protein M5U12_11590 [Verrucomicrobia bacterium]|nr:hypothetical protein [Verrucomicrobiota bacterium]